MKKLFFAVSALAALSLLAPTTGFAQGANNQFGWYTDAAMGGTHIDGTAYSTQIVYMIVSNPYNETEDRPIESIYGVEFSFTVPNGNVLSTTWTNNDTALDVATVLGDHYVGWGTPVPVASNMVQLGTKSILLMTADPIYVHVAAVSNGASIPGFMAIGDNDGLGIQAVYPSSGDLVDPIFAFNGTVVANEETSFDNLKALYR